MTSRDRGRFFEKLKKQLAAEGLFDKENKQELPAFPKEIVLLTSPSGAAIHDFLKIWREKNFPVDIKVFPVRVQGDEAATEIAQALNTVNKKLPKFKDLFYPLFWQPLRAQFNKK